LDGLKECFTPKVSQESQTTRKQLFENMLVLEVFAGSSNLTIEIRKANLTGVAIDKTVGRAKGHYRLGPDSGGGCRFSF
jgi:tRNA G37 N-methylase Trm5